MRSQYTAATEFMDLTREAFVTGTSDSALHHSFGVKNIDTYANPFERNRAASVCGEIDINMTNAYTILSNQANLRGLAHSGG